ncbi:dual specificity protein phosphatase 22 isoform X2 [Daktulosphaira vitifoliae]|uniref:dual specificity protein phosphatase 22 isoform X2 n=1 Tax=Daktulosphaira vitifoliae TaxID=58002 RepID=UPI0021AAEFAE|nr:dual specificity protein phosphatase 22 isoform X2 [Daktulosphaira vitifoliae]
MNMIIPGLYIGSLRDSKDINQLEKNKITHILSIIENPRKYYHNKNYMFVKAYDSPEQNLIQYFTICNNFIHKARLKDQNVLIHCLAGMSRSVTIVASYIMSVTNIKLKHAIRLLKLCRPIASPNEGFNKQLQYFELYYLSEERDRLKSFSTTNKQLKADEEYCKRFIEDFQKQF